MTAEKVAAFLAALAESANVTKACKAVELARETVYTWREENADFAARWDKALSIGVAALEDEAHRRAFDGVDEPVFYQGAPCGSVRKYSDTLTIFLLKAHRPERYRERFEHTGANGAPLVADPPSMTEVARRVAFLLTSATQDRS